MANNPWRKIAPADLLEKYLEFSPVRQILVLLSWVYVFGSFLLLAFGAIHSRRSRNTMLQILGLASVVVALANTLISMVTIGDNRFRVPILPFIIILHALGLIGIQSFLKERLIRLKEVPNK